MIKKILSATVFSCIFLIANAQESPSWTLDQCIEYAMLNNNDLKSALLDVSSNEYYLKQSKLDRLPNLNGSVGWFNNYGRSIDPTTNLFTKQNASTTSLNLSSNVTLFAGNQKLNTIKQNEMQLKSSQHSLEFMGLQVTSYITSAYFRVLLAKGAVEVATEQMDISQDQLDNNRKLANAGKIPEGNVLEFEAQVAQSQLTLTETQNELAISLLNLQLTMNRNPEINFDIVDPQIEVDEHKIEEYGSPTELFLNAIDTYPDILSAKYQAESANKGIEIAKGTQYPSLTLSGSLGSSQSSARNKFDALPGGFDTIGTVIATGDQVLASQPNILLQELPYPYFNQIGDNFNQSFGLTLSIPIFNRGFVRNNIQQAEVQSQKADIFLNDRMNRYRNDIYDAYYNAFAGSKKYVSARDNVAAIRKSFEYITKRADQGLVKPIEFNISQNNLVIAEANFLQAKYDYLLDLKILDLLIGKPLTLD